MSRPLVIVPYVTLHPMLMQHLMHEQVVAVFEDTSGADGYVRVLQKWWREGQPFVLLEQDKFPEPGLLGELWRCDEDWCAVRTPMRDSDAPAPYPSLSCVKFGWGLMQQAPRLMCEVARLDLGLGEGEWSRLDMGVAGLLEGVYGAECHWHDGVVDHRHQRVAA